MTPTDPVGPDNARRLDPDAAPVPTRPAGPTRRQVHERRQRRRSTLIAAASTIVVAAALVTLVVTAKGWPEIRRSFLSWHDFQGSFGDVARAFGLNVRIFLTAEVCILAFSLVLALARSSRSPYLFPARLFATVYSDVFRGIPTLLVLFLVVFGIPGLQIQGVPKDPVLLATVSLVLSYSAYVSEVFRAGIDSVHESQRGAARSLGLTSSQAMRHVVLPQAVRRVIPPLLNDFIALQKETSIVGVVGPIEAARQAQIYSSYNFNFTSYFAAAALFLAVTIPLTRFTDWLLRRQRRRTGAGVMA